MSNDSDFLSGILILNMTQIVADLIYWHPTTEHWQDEPHDIEEAKSQVLNPDVSVLPKLTSDMLLPDCLSIYTVNQHPNSFFFQRSTVKSERINGGLSDDSLFGTQRLLKVRICSNCLD
ncbi:hypothetical protein CDL60_26240 [Roseateles noduli]|nr:hypothetical protein CDL60_26240 [Roseateles noduli]